MVLTTRTKLCNVDTGDEFHYLVPGIAFICQDALGLFMAGTYVRPCPGLERTTAMLNGRRSKH